jgi:DNA-binding NarL/FixJ family response regulator
LEPLTRRIGAGLGEPTGTWGSLTFRARCRAGRLLRGSLVGEARIAVLIESARPAEQATAFADLYGLTGRERAITNHVARRLSTKEIADRLHASTYTVQDHLPRFAGMDAG